MSRATTILALLQTLVIVVGFLALGAVLKMAGYPATIAVRWNPLAVFLREHGMAFLLLPVLWVFFATAAERVDRGFLSYRVAFIVGLCVACTFLMLFVHAILFPYTVPILIRVQ